MTVFDSRTDPVGTTTGQEPAVTPKPMHDMVALVLLASDLPMPTNISFQGAGAGETGRSIMAMRLRSVSDGQAWSRYLGGRTDVCAGPSGRSWLEEGLIRWHGWHVLLHACDAWRSDLSAADTDPPAHPNGGA